MDNIRIALFPHRRRIWDQRMQFERALHYAARTLLVVAVSALSPRLAASEPTFGGVELAYEHEAGGVTTPGSYPDAHVEVGGRTIFRAPQAGSITISAAFPDWKNPSTLVLLLSTGGNACSGFYVVLDIPTERVTEQFGTCGTASIRQTQTALILAFKDNSGTVAWVYKNGKLAKLPKLNPEQHIQRGIAAYNQNDFEKAIEHLWAVLDHPSPDAPLYLGMMAHLGRGVAQDYRAAMQLYREAADRGSSAASYRIGVLYANGRGVPKDQSEATRWYRQAAEAGDGIAEYNVGLGYLNGQGLTKDNKEALFWLSLAKDRVGDPKLVAAAEKHASIAESRLSEAERQEVQQRVLTWSPKSINLEFGAANVRGWVGKYPVGDRLRGFEFFDTPEVQIQLKAALGPTAPDQMKAMAVVSPIVESGGWITAGGCQPHMCPDGKWSLAINVTTLETRACLLPLGSNVAHYGSTKSEKIDLPASKIDCPSENTIERFDAVFLQAEKARVSSSAISVSMKSEGGTYVLPVEVNGALTLDFVVDSGASDVSVPMDVVSTLIRTGTIGKSDVIGAAQYALADGSTASGVRFRIHSLKIGNVTIRDVVGSAGPERGSLLLGQSFLRKFKSWSIDNSQHRLILEP